MRHETSFKNSYYIHMMEEMESLNQESSTEDSVVPFGILYRLWCDGAFDEYSDDHFIIRAFNEDLEYFRRFFETHYMQMTYASAPYATIEHFPTNYVINFENAIRALVSAFGYDKIRRFVTDQLSAGKENYDEEVFFAALSEIHILAFFCVYGGMSSVMSEPMEFDKNGKIKIAKEPIDIIYIDPPYDTDYLIKSLQILQKSEFVSEETKIILETDNENRILKYIEDLEFEIKDKRKYGIAYIIFLQRMPK